MDITPGAIEAAVKTYLAAEYATAGETATLHSKVPDRPPARFVTVKRIGGLRQGSRDSAQMEFGCFAKTEDDARALADLTRERIWALKPVSSWANGVTISNITVYRVTEVGGPVNSPYSASTPPRYRFSEQIDYRMAP